MIAHQNDTANRERIEENEYQKEPPGLLKYFFSFSNDENEHVERSDDQDIEHHPDDPVVGCTHITVVVERNL